MTEDLEFSEILIEMQPQGAYVRVTAMDPDSLTEIVVVGAASASEEYLRQLAIRKLNFVMKKNKKG